MFLDTSSWLCDRVAKTSRRVEKSRQIIATAEDRKGRSLRQLERDRWRLRASQARITRTQTIIGDSLTDEQYNAANLPLMTRKWGEVAPTGTAFATLGDSSMTHGQGTAARALRVLVVDDNRDAADTLAQLVSAWGCATRVAYDGVAGLESACDFRPDCLISDIKMPGLDGYTLAERVRHQPGLERTKLVALSAFTSGEHRQRCRAAGFDHTLTKPADFDELQEILTMLEQVLRLAEQTEEMSRKNVALATETKSLMEDVKKDIKEVKDDVREMKDDIREALDRPRD